RKLSSLTISAMQLRSRYITTAASVVTPIMRWRMAVGMVSARLAAAELVLAGLEQLGQQRRSQARPGRGEQPSILNQGLPVDEAFIERADVGPDGFLQDDVGRGDRAVQSGEQRQRTSAVMHRGRHVMDLGQLDDSPGLADSPRPRRVDH